MKITTNCKADETPDNSAATATLTTLGDTATVGAGTPPGDTSAGATVTGPGRRMAAPGAGMAGPGGGMAGPGGLRPRGDESGTSTARQLRKIILVTLLTALLLDSSGFARTGQGMPPGLSRTLILAVGTPVDAVARALHLGGPKHWLDAAFGHPDFTAGGGGMENGSALPTWGPPAAPTLARRDGQGQRGMASGRKGRQAQAIGHVRRTPPRLRHPTRSDPLRVLVTGDSLSSYIGQQLSAITARSGLVDVTTVTRDGTGLTNPGLFNWGIGARQEVTGQHYDAVVMVIGANDGWPMRVNGLEITSVGSSAWVREYARRIVTVEKAFTAGGQGRVVLWVGPPVPRGATWAHVFARLNSAAGFAAPFAPGGQYVNIAGPTSIHGRYTDYLSRPGGRPVLARQPDGVHFTYQGAVFPALVILGELQRDFGRLS